MIKPRLEPAYQYIERVLCTFLQAQGQCPSSLLAEDESGTEEMRWCQSV